jgi:hypothetical protein
MSHKTQQNAALSIKTVSVVLQQTVASQLKQVFIALSKILSLPLRTAFLSQLSIRLCFLLACFSFSTL